jgi:hypothetical protein
VASSGRYLIPFGADYPYFQAFWRGTKLVILRQTHRAALAFKFFPAKVIAPQKARSSVSGQFLIPARCADGFVILPSVRHEWTMTPFFFNALAIGTTTVYSSSEIAHTRSATS